MMNVPGNQPAAWPLSLSARGTTVIVQEIRGGRKMRQRLLDLGLNQGAEVQVLKNDRPGPLIIAVKRDGRLGVDRNMSQRIMVRPKSNQ